MVKKVQDALEGEVPEHLFTDEWVDSAVQVSQAISLKRIANALEQISSSVGMISVKD